MDPVTASATKPQTRTDARARIAVVLPWSICGLLALAALYLGFGWWDACIRVDSLQNQVQLSELKTRDAEQRLAAEVLISRKQIERLRAAGITEP